MPRILLVSERDCVPEWLNIISLPLPHLPQLNIIFLPLSLTSLTSLTSQSSLFSSLSLALPQRDRSCTCEIQTDT